MGFSQISEAVKRQLLCFLLLLPFLASSQTLTKFSPEPDKFVKEITDLLNATKREDCAATAAAFAANFKAGTLASKLPKIQEASDVMLYRNMRAYPHFEQYLRTVNNYVAANKPDDLFNKWSDILVKVTKEQRRGETKDFMAYTEFADGLFSQGAMYVSQSKTWLAKSDNYTLQFDSVPSAFFPTVDLTVFTAKDTINIKGTSGAYYPLRNIWVGKKGRVDWTRAGHDPNTVYADAKSYRIDVTQSDFKMDSVTFYNKQYFDYSLEGNFSDKLTPQKNDISYPRFTSFRKDLAIKDLAPNVNFVGGFALNGTKVIGTGDEYSKATLFFFNSKNEKVLSVKSKEILLKKTESLAADNAEISLYLDKDSIYHPGLTMIYKIKLEEVNLYRGESGIASTPFFDSYHRHEIKTDALVWKINEPFINVKMLSGAGKAPATFTSDRFFRLGELQKFQGMMDFNIVSSIYAYSKKNDTREILAEDLAKKINPNYTVNTIQDLLYKLIENGFIFYDADRQVITVRDKVFTYIAANSNDPRYAIDYDVIQINSYTPNLNGKLFFDKKDISLVGVKEVLLSDSQSVYVYPDTGKIQIGEGRDMDFSGKVSAGRLDFQGTGFRFEYDTFMLDLTNLASAMMWVPSGEFDKTGAELLKPMTSKIEGLTGFLNIDKPDNKSGKKNYAEYPVFTNMEKSYVYYADSFIHKGAYIKDSFYFLLDPFVFDSLDSFDPYLSDFKGDLYSSDIFPTFRENLKVQKDLSFGFKRVTPEKGFPLYKGKGTYNDSIFLSNAGLRGDGKIKYLFNTIESDSIIFFPDSMDAFAQNFEMKKTTYEGVTFPPVKGYNNQIHWLPYLDSMLINMTDSPFVMYDSAQLKGNLMFTKKGLKGNGDFDFREASMASELFNFESVALHSDTINLVIKSIAEDKVTFKTPNVRGRIDFEKREGEFKSNDINIPTTFDNNKYKTSINEFFWDMDGNFLDFKVPPGSAGVYFTSTDPAQDSLKFLGQRAFFDMTTSIIDVDSVFEVRIADASIKPEGKRVTIQPGGLLDTLKNAVVVFDTTNKKNKVYNAVLTIESIHKFSGNGIFDYQIGSSKPYPIIVHDMGVKEVKDRKKLLYYTYANGTLEPEEHFMLHPKIEFKGSMNISQETNRPRFNGFAQLNLENTLIPTSWFAINEEVNTDTFLLHYDHPAGEDTSGARMFSGIFYSPYDSLTSLYAAIMQPTLSNKDLQILNTKGILKYDDKKRTWILGDEKKVVNPDALTGNLLKYDEQKNIVEAEGKFEFGFQLEPVVLKATGNVTQKIDSNKFTFNTLLALNIPMQKDLAEFFGTDLINNTLDRPNLEYVKPAFEKSLAEMVDVKKAEKTIADLRTTGQFLKPKELEKFNILLGEVKLIYEPYYQIYRSAGAIGTSYIGTKGVHKKLNGFVELGYRKGNDFFNIYFEGANDSWYFISFSNNTLQLLSSNKDFNMLLSSIVPQNRNAELASEEFYFYTASTYKKMQDFLYRMRQIEKGIRVETVEQTEEEIFEEELEQIKKELLNLPPVDTTQPIVPEIEEVVPQKGKKKKEEISFIQKEPTIEQEQPDMQYVRPEDWLKGEDTLQQQQPPVEEKGKKKKGKEVVEEEVAPDEEDPYADDDEDPELEIPKEYQKKKEEAQPQEETQQEEQAEPQEKNENAPSDFEQIMGGEEGKKKKKKGD